MVFVDVKLHERRNEKRKRITPEVRSCVKEEVAVLGSPSLTSLMFFVDVKYHERRKEDNESFQSSGAVPKKRWRSWAPRP